MTDSFLNSDSFEQSFKANCDGFDAAFYSVMLMAPPYKSIGSGGLGSRAALADLIAFVSRMLCIKLCIKGSESLVND